MASASPFLSFCLSEPASNHLSLERPSLVSVVPCSFWALKHWDCAVSLFLILTPEDVGSATGQLLPPARSAWHTEPLWGGRHAAVWAGVLCLCWVDQPPRPQSPWGLCMYSQIFTGPTPSQSLGERKKKIGGNGINEDKFNRRVAPPSSACTTDHVHEEGPWLCAVLDCP